MNHYPHHIGDFNTATRHLTRLERGLFRDMLDMYFDKEQPLEGADISLLARRLLCHTPEEVAALQFLLGEFFERLDDGRYQNLDCERVIALYRAQQDVQQQVKSNENERQVRSRARRSAIFTALQSLGVHPEGMTKMADLLALCRQHGVTVTKTGAHVTPKEGAAGGVASSGADGVTPAVTARHGDVTGNQNQNQNQIPPNPPAGGDGVGLAIASAMGVFFPVQRRQRIAEVAELVGDLIQCGTVTGEELLAAAEQQKDKHAEHDGKYCPGMLRWLREKRWLDSAGQPQAGASKGSWRESVAGADQVGRDLGLQGYQEGVDNCAGWRTLGDYVRVIEREMAKREQGVN